MKNLLFLCMTALVFACTKSPEERAKDMIQESVKRILYNPESYDAVSLSIDSAFTPYGSPDFYKQTLKVYELGTEIRSLRNIEREKKSSMEWHSGPYQSSYDKKTYNEAKEEYDETVAKREKLEKKVNKMVNELKEQIKAEQQFIGFWAYHCYRAKNNAGATQFGEIVFLFNKELNQIVDVYDPSESDFKQVMMLYMLMQGRDIELENDAWRIDTDLWDEIWN